MKNPGGVGGNLLFAFLGVSAFAALSGGVAIYAFITVGEALQRIARDRVPVAVASQQLSRRAERIAAAAPELLRVGTRRERDAASESVASELEALGERLDALKGLDVEPRSLSLIEKLIEHLGANLSTVDSLIVNGLALGERRDELLRDLRANDLSTRRLLGPRIETLDARVAEVRPVLGGDVELHPPTLEQLGRLAGPIVALAPLRRALAEASSVSEALIEAASAASVTDLDALTPILRRSLGSLDALASAVDADLAIGLRERTEEFRYLVDADDGIVSLRRAELERLDNVRILLAQNKAFSKRLTEAVDTLVASAELDVRAATEEALRVQRASTMIIGGVVALSLICSTLIVWLYVKRRLIRRLTDLSDSMMAIAKGNLETPIPGGGRDEIAGMAQALEVFRDTAVAVRATNVREIQEARRRLTEAIESIGEGFCLYDSDDRLVLCNSRFRDIIYPGIKEVLVPGTRFETVLRSAARQGLIREARGREAEWIEDRIESHRSPSEPLLQQQSDGRWIQIREYRTETSGTVGVYTEVTELIEQARELEAWNRDLERRVADQVREIQKIDQLKRFFPPQLADAIVSDDRGGVLDDHRREVTVVFCDLRGFTAFSSVSEPEEEMHILREYHAVICPLIFRYGATLEHFAGDGVMSFLNDPVQHPDHVRRAVDMAHAMRAGMRELGKAWSDRGVDLGFGVGIGTGFATLGRIGTRELFHYAAIGSVANLSARLCDEAKDGQVLIPQRVYSLIEGDYEADAVGAFNLKGFPHPVNVYNVTGPVARETAASPATGPAPPAPC